MSGSTRDETYRATVRVMTPHDGPTTLIVTRQGLGRSARVWLTTGATMLSTVVLTDEQADELAARIAAARATRPSS